MRLPIPAIIVTGFLGCGKTSFLRRVLPVCGELGLRPALIVNEVGDVDVDGELLADLNTEQIKLIGGCVCCTLQSQLAATVDDILERREYDLIIIECSGLSNPLDVVNVLSAPAFLTEIVVSHIICLLDASRAARILGGPEIARDQVASSDVLILNKADTVASEHMPEVEALAGSFNPNISAHWASFGGIGEDCIQALLISRLPLHSGSQHHDHGHQHSLPASFCTVALDLPENVLREHLESALRSLPENVVRAKGFAHVDGEGWRTLHKVYDSVNISPFPGTGPKAGAVLVCIGRNLSLQQVADAMEMPGHSTRPGSETNSACGG